MPGKKAFGAKFGVYAANVLTNYANITKITPYKAKASTADVTSHDSPVDANGNPWKENLATILEAGAATFDLNYDPNNATHAALMAMIGVMQTFKVTFPSAAPAVVCTFSGFIDGVSNELPFDNKQTCSVSVMITGIPAFGAT